MSPPVFLATSAQLLRDPVRLTGPEGRHAATVRRLGVGEAVDLTDGAGLVAHCRVSGAGRDALELEVLGRHREPAPAPRFVVVQALAKGERGELAVAAMTEVGVDVVVPWSAARSVTRWQGERGLQARDRWWASAREAATRPAPWCSGRWPPKWWRPPRVLATWCCRRPSSCRRRS